MIYYGLLLKGFFFLWIVRLKLLYLLIKKIFFFLNLHRYQVKFIELWIFSNFSKLYRLSWSKNVTLKFNFIDQAYHDVFNRYKCPLLKLSGIDQGFWSCFFSACLSISMSYRQPLNSFSRASAYICHLRLTRFIFSDGYPKWENNFSLDRVPFINSTRHVMFFNFFFFFFK